MLISLCFLIEHLRFEIFITLLVMKATGSLSTKTALVACRYNALLVDVFQIVETENVDMTSDNEEPYFEVRLQ